MNLLEEQHDMRRTMDYLVECILAHDEQQFESFLGTYKLYRSVLAQEGRFDLIQDGQLGPDRIRLACNRALRKGITNKNLMPESILKSCMKVAIFHHGALKAVHEHYPSLHGDIVDHFRQRPMEILPLLQPHFRDDGAWIFEHLEKKDPDLLTQLIQFNLPFLREIDGYGFDRIIPILYYIDDKPLVSQFLEHWQAGILKSWKDHADNLGQVLDTRTINVITQHGTAELRRKLWNPLTLKGIYQDYAPIRDIPLGFSQKEITDWLRTGYQHATFIFSLALENQHFDLKSLSSALVEGYDNKRDWAVKGLHHALETIRHKGDAVSDERLMAVLEATTKALRGHPMEEAGLFELAEGFGKQTVMKTRLGRERSDLFFGQDLGL